MSGRKWRGHGILWWVVWFIIVGWIVGGLVGLLAFTLLTYIAGQ